MSDVSLERRYARALFKLAEERKKEDAWLGELKAVEGALHDFRELQAALLNRFINLNKRYRVVDELGSRLKLDREIISFLKLLIDRKRLDHFDGICRAFEESVDQKLHRVQVEVRSAQPLQEALIQELKSLLKGKLSQEIRLASQLDERLIGGFQLAWQGRLYDGSARGRLDSLHKKLAG